MTAARLKDVLTPACAGRYAVAGLVVLGWEDAKAYVEAAESLNLPVILQAGPGCRRHTPVAILGQMFRHLADNARVPVVCHIDHAKTAGECAAGIAAGFTSVMIDGSALPLAENIRLTQEVVALARPQGISVEGEVGYVGYAQGQSSQATAPEDAARFERETGIDALAVSVGNVHLQTEKAASIDFAALAEIERVTTVPLVLHGGSGIDGRTRQKLARDHRIKKFNIGTELRQAFGQGLRAYLAQKPDAFDRIEILSAAQAPVITEAKRILAELARP